MKISTTDPRNPRVQSSEVSSDVPGCVSPTSGETGVENDLRGRWSVSPKEPPGPCMVGTRVTDKGDGSCESRSTGVLDEE